MKTKLVFATFVASAMLLLTAIGAGPLVGPLAISTPFDTTC